MPVPFFSGTASFQKQWPFIHELLEGILERGVFTSGPTVAKFEKALQLYTGAEHAIAVGSATDALIIMLIAAGIGPGDEVIVPCFTFFASASSIAHVGATPIFVDIDPVTYLLDPAAVEAKITSKTRAIMPVHLFTQVADMPAIGQIALHHQLMILEDSAEGIDMWCNSVHAGLMGSAGVLSFFPTKTLGALGDAGMILTQSSEIAHTCRLLRNHGQAMQEPYVYHHIGYNSRMDEIQAAILLVRLQSLVRDIARRTELARLYTQHLGTLAPQVTTPQIPERTYSTTPVYYAYVIEAERRDELVQYLASQNIGTETYYPMPLHLQPCFAYLKHSRGDFPVAERVCTRTVALPFYPDLTIEQLESVCAAIKAFYKRDAIS